MDPLNLSKPSASQQSIKDEFLPECSNKYLNLGAALTLKSYNIKTNELVEKINKINPDFIPFAFSIVDKNRNKIFKNIHQIAYFLLMPPIYLGKSFGKKSYDYPSEFFNKALKESFEALCIIKQLCQFIESDDSTADYLIALKDFRVDFAKLTHLDLSMHPNEVVFYQVYPLSKEKEETAAPRALILMGNPQADHESIGYIHLNAPLYRSIVKICSTVNFKIISSPEEIKSKIVNASVGEKKIKYLILEAHGSQENIYLSGKPDGSDEQKVLDDSTLNKELFEDLREDSEILLHSCLTGKPTKNPNVEVIAQKIANIASKDVFAPDRSISSGEIRLKDGNFITSSIFYRVVKFSPRSK